MRMHVAFRTWPLNLDAFDMFHAGIEHQSVSAQQPYRQPQPQPPRQGVEVHNQEAIKSADSLSG